MDNSNNFTITRSVHNSAADGEKMGTISGTDNSNNFTLTRSVHNSAADGGKITGYTAGSLAAALGAASLKGISNKFKFDDDEKEE